MVWKMSQLPLFLAAWNVFSVVESTTIDLCTDLGPVVQPERCGWCYGVTLVEDDYQFLAPLRHNGGHLWSITTIYYGFSTSPTGHCTPCAEYRSSHSTQLSTCQSQKPLDLRMFQKDATTLNLLSRLSEAFSSKIKTSYPIQDVMTVWWGVKWWHPREVTTLLQFFKDVLEDADEGSLDEAHSIDIQIAQCY